MQYRLRTLLMLLAIGPPLLAWGWLVGASVMAEYRARQQQADEWFEVGGPGTIAGFDIEIRCDFEMEVGRDEDSTAP